MNITKEKKDDRLVIFIDGKLDTLTSPQLDAELKSAFEESDTVEVNMENLAYISSAGLRVLHSTHKRVKGSGKLLISCGKKRFKNFFSSALKRSAVSR